MWPVARLSLDDCSTEHLHLLDREGHGNGIIETISPSRSLPRQWVVVDELLVHAIAKMPLSATRACRAAHGERLCRIWASICLQRRRVRSRTETAPAMPESHVAVDAYTRAVCGRSSARADSTHSGSRSPSVALAVISSATNPSARACASSASRASSSDAAVAVSRRTVPPASQHRALARTPSECGS